MKLSHKLWLKLNDYHEYDVKYSSWQIYKEMYKNNMTFSDSDIIRNNGRPYINCVFIHNGKEKMFSNVEYDGCRNCAFARNIRIGPECE